MINNSIREFTCDECYEVSKVDWSQVRPDIDDGTSNIEIHVKDNGYAYYGGCMNCGNLVEIEPPVPDLVADNVDVDKDGMFIQITDKITNRSCWIEAWQDKDGEWLYEFNTVRFNLDDDKEIIDMMFQNELKDYPDEVYECIMEAIEDNEEEYNKLQENKAPTMRDRLKEAKAGTVSIKAYGKIYYEFSEDEWNSMSEEDKESTIVDTADQATDEEGHTVHEDEIEVITESKKVETLHADQKEKLADGTTRIKLVDNGHEQWFIVKSIKDNGGIDYDYDYEAEQSDEDRNYFDCSVDVNDVEETLLKTMKECKEVKTESVPADVIEYFGMQDNTDETFKDNVAKEYKTLRAEYPDKEMILNGDFGTYLGTEKAEPIEKGEYITVYNKVEENKTIKTEDTTSSDKTAEKSAEKIVGSMIKKENVEMNNAGKINNSLDKNKIAKFLEKAITDLTTTDYTCIWYNLDDDLALFVGWTEGYDTNDETVIHSKDDPSYVIASKIASNHEFMKTDLDWLIQPYGENGDVWDTQMALSPNEDFINTAEWYIGEYKEIRDAIDKGELLLENKKVTESKTANMDQVDIVMEFENGEITIEDVADWNKVKSVADSLKGSQGFYVRLLASMLDAEEEFGGVENLPFPITM